MEIRNLKSFVQVCEYNSFSKAADNLGYTQSTITAQIGQLEKELGVPLFDRRGKTFRINENGEALLGYARSIIALSEEVTGVLSDREKVRGRLRIGIIESLSSYFMPDILERFLKTYPDVTVEVYISKTLDIMEALRQNRVDLIITLDEPVFDPSWELSYELPERVIFLCHPEHRFANRSVSLEEVTGEKIILTEKDANYRCVFDRICDAHKLVPDSPLEIGHTALILSYVEKGIGITILPEVTARQAIETGRLAEFRVNEAEINMFIQMFYRKDRWLTPANRAFQEMVIDGSSGQPDE